MRLKQINFAQGSEEWLNCEACQGNFAARFTGQLLIRKTGRYTFWVTSDDGSVLKIGSKTVVNNDGVHGMRTKKGSTVLKPGTPSLDIWYFNVGSKFGLQVYWSGPGFDKKQ